jgi:threonine synthase
MINCLNCNLPYPEDTTPYICPVCDGLFDFSVTPEYAPAKVSDEPGIWRYRHTFGLPTNAPSIYLGEGDTPLVLKKILGKEIAFKLEFQNPTGSFKDRGSAVMISFLRSRGAQIAADDSSGNAGASFAAYASSAGIKAKVFVPSYASGPKTEQILAYGADLIPVPGPRSNASKEIRQEADRGTIYASHAYFPQSFPGYATTAFELVDQLGISPGSILLPAGQGNLLLSIGRGFEALYHAKVIDSLPRIFGVQAARCAPLWTVYYQGKNALSNLIEGETIAEGVRIITPHRLDALLGIVRKSQGRFVAVQENKILSGQQTLAKLGFYVEPTSALVWNALEQVIDDIPEPIVVVLTGSGLKTR